MGVEVGGACGLEEYDGGERRGVQVEDVYYRYREEEDA